MDTAIPEESRDVVHKMLDGAETQMRDAARQLEAEGDPAGNQANAYQALKTLWIGIAPFQAVLQRAIDVQGKNLEAPHDFEAADELHVAELAALLTPKAQGEMKSPQGAQLKDAYEKAIELSPKIVELAQAAATDLREDRRAEALPREREALRLLEEIASLLPKQDQQQQEQDQQDQQDQKEQDEQDEKEQEQQDQQQQQKEDEKQQQQQPKMSPEQLESLLRKAEEREREHEDEKKKKAAAVVVPGGKVERDW